MVNGGIKEAKKVISSEWKKPYEMQPDAATPQMSQKSCAAGLFPLPCTANDA
jgi:hypothetical protein